MKIVIFTLATILIGTTVSYYADQNTQPKQVFSQEILEV